MWHRAPSTGTSPPHARPSPVVNLRSNKAGRCEVLRMAKPWDRAFLFASTLNPHGFRISAWGHSCRDVMSAIWHAELSRSESADVSACSMGGGRRSRKCPTATGHHWSTSVANLQVIPAHTPVSEVAERNCRREPFSEIPSAPRRFERAERLWQSASGSPRAQYRK